MFVGVLQVELVLDRAQSLKDKRQVIRSILDRMRATFNVSAAEGEDMDKWQRAVLGFAAVSNDQAHVSGLLQKALNHLKRHPVARVVDHRVEIL